MKQQHDCAQALVKYTVQLTTAFLRQVCGI